MSKIFDNLFLGNYKDAKNDRYLKRNGITHIVTVGVELKPIFPNDYKYLYIPAYDTPGYKLSMYFEQIADFINNAMENESGKVFVHCYMGISRSTTSILAYLIKYHKIPPLKGRLFVKSKRGIIWPNDGFMKQLEAYAKRLGVIEGKMTMRNIENSASANPSLLPNIKKEDAKENDVKSATIASGLWKSGVLGERKSVNKDYYCKNCGIKVFNSSDIEHDNNRTVGGTCNIVYLRSMPWIVTMKSPSTKIFCPNTKCNSILGFSDQKGGKCNCGQRIDKIFAVYPLRIITSKKPSKPLAQIQSPAMSQTNKAW